MEIFQFSNAWAILKIKFPWDEKIFVDFEMSYILFCGAFVHSISTYFIDCTSVKSIENNHDDSSYKFRDHYDRSWVLEVRIFKNNVEYSDYYQNTSACLGNAFDFIWKMLVFVLWIKNYRRKYRIYILFLKSEGL